MSDANFLPQVSCRKFLADGAVRSTEVHLDIVPEILVHSSNMHYKT